jgi:hypothetical protein
MQKRLLVFALAALLATALIVATSIHRPSTAHASPRDETNLTDRVATLEQRLGTLEKLVESLHSKKVDAKLPDLLRTRREEVAEKLRTKVAEYLNAVADPSTGAIPIQLLGLEVERQLEVLQAVVDRERQLERDKGVTTP